MSLNAGSGFFTARENRSSNQIIFTARNERQQSKEMKPTHVRNATGCETVRDRVDAFDNTRRSQAVPARSRDHEWGQRHSAGMGSGFNLRSSLPAIETTGNQTERGRHAEEQSPRFVRRLPQIESSVNLISHDIGQTRTSGDSSVQNLGKSHGTGPLFSTFDRRDQEDLARASIKNESQNKLIGRRANIFENQNSREEAAMRGAAIIKETITPISSILNSASGPNTPPRFDEVAVGSRPDSLKSSRRQSQVSNNRTNNNEEGARTLKYQQLNAPSIFVDTVSNSRVEAGGADLPAASEGLGAANDLEHEADSLRSKKSQPQFKIQPKGLPNHKPPIFRTKLTNQFASNSNMKTAMSANLGDMFTNQMMGAYQKNAEYDVDGRALGSLLQDGSRNSQEFEDDDVQMGVEKGTLQQHFDVQKVFPGKCNVSICYKIRDKRFLLKSISQDIIELQEFANEVNHTTRKKIGQHLFKNFQIDMFDPWINIPPQVPQQNFVSCYGILKVFNAKMGGLIYYTMTELVEDDALTTAQKNLYESKLQQTRQLNKTLSIGMYGKSSLTLRVDKGEEEGVTIQQSTGLTTAKSKRRTPLVRKRTVQELMVQNLVKQQVLASEVDGFESLDDAKAFIRKIAQRSSADLDAAVVDDLAAELQAGVQRAEQPSMEDNPISTETFYGKREPPESIKVSLNMYKKIKHLDLGNLSSLPAIPEHYQRILIGYIIQISRSLAYAHRHNLVHGNFNLSKVLCQKVAAGCQSDPNLLGKQEMKRQYRQLDYEIHNFYIVNFEPYQVYRYLEQYSKEDKLQKLFAVKKMKLDTAAIMQMIKIMDIQKFANSIIQIMCGVSDPSVNFANVSGSQEPESDPNALKQKSQNAQPITGGIQMDLIPLNWQKLPFNRSIMKILAMLFGPYNTAGNIKVKSSQILEEINEIATNIYTQHCLKPEDCNGKCQQERTEKSSNPTAHANRLRTVSLNNQAVAKFLNLTDTSSVYDILIYHEQIESLLAHAIKVCPYNQVAHLNLYLFRWRTGAIPDDQFQMYIQNNVFKLDKELSRLMFILFKKNIQGGSISDKEIKETVAVLEKKNQVISNIASFVFDHPDFLEYKKKRGSKKLNQEKVMFINSQFKNDGIKLNHQIVFKGAFQATDFFFSNNDCYLVAINSTDLHIIDVRSGIKVFSRRFNDEDQLESRQEESEKSEPQQDSDAEETSSDESELARRPPKGRGKAAYKWNAVTRQLEGDRVDERKQLAGEHARICSAPTGHMGNETEKASARPPMWQTLACKAHEQATADVDRQRVNMQFPPKWLVSVSNSGKIFALYNRSQLIRNKHYKFKKNISETLHVYSVATFSAKIKSNEKSYQVDIQKMLDGNELLSVGVDDVIPMDFNQISVQGKDLHLYIIDFVQNVLIRKIDDVRQSIEMKSIFRDVRRRGANEEYFESLKEYIQQEQRKGNEVRLPKINEDIVAVRIKDTNLVQLYHIRLKTVVRQLNLHLHEIKFNSMDFFSKKNEAVSESDESLFEDNAGPDDLIGQEYAQEQIEQRIAQYVTGTVSAKGLKKTFGRAGTKRGSARPLLRDSKTIQGWANRYQSESSTLEVIQEGERLSSPLEPASSKQVEHFELSPQAKVIAAQIGNVVFVRVLNQVNRDQYLNTLEYHHSITFMPLYLDEDYNFQENKKKYKRQRQAKAGRGFDTESSESDTDGAVEAAALGIADDRETCHFDVSAETVDRAIALYQALTVKAAGLTLQARNDKMRELTPFVRHYAREPTAIYPLHLKPRSKYQKIAAAFEIMRTFPTLDRLAVSSAGFGRLTQMRSYDQLHLQRSFEFVRDFTCSSNPRKVILAALIFRKLHVYDFIRCSLLFTLNLSHPMSPGCANRPRNSLLFIDSDQVIVVQDGQSRITLVSLSCQIEAHSRSQVKHKVEDQTLSMKGPNMQQEFDEGFYFGGSRIGQQVQEAGAKADEESDNIEEDARGTTVIELNEVIENMFSSRSNSPYGYLVVLCKDKFYLFYIYEEDCQGCEKDLIWECDYKFERSIRKYGKILCTDFEDKCEAFVSGSNSGYVCCWAIVKKEMTHAFQIINPLTNRAEPIGQITNHNDGKVIISYSYHSQTLLLTTDQEKGKHITKPKTVVLEQDSGKLGNVTNIKVNSTHQFLVVSFQSGALHIYNMTHYGLHKKVAPLPRCLINDVPFHSNFFIDELCSYLAYLGDNQRHFHFHAMDWTLQCKALAKPRFNASTERKSTIKAVQAPAVPPQAGALARMMTLQGEISSKVCAIF